MLNNKLNLPQPFVDACKSDYTYKEKQYSVTSLLKGVCQTILERRHKDEIEEDVADKVWLVFGKAVHKILEESQETKDQLKEGHFVIDVGNYKLSGIFDLYDEKEKEVTDYKTGSVWKVIYDEWEDYRKQLLIYAYMLRHIGFECDKGKVVMLLKDHSKTKVEQDPSYPKHPVFIKYFKFTDKDFEEIEEFIFRRFELISHYETLLDEELPPCTPEERWAEPDKWAVKKKGNKKAIKLYDNLDEAVERAEAEGLEIEYRKGSNKRCENYCDVKDFCPFYKFNNRINEN